MRPTVVEPEESMVALPARSCSELASAVVGGGVVVVVEFGVPFPPPQPATSAAAMKAKIND